MKSSFNIILLCLVFSAPSFAEVTKIVEVLDTNLYRTEAGALVSLANVQTVSIHDPDSSYAPIAKMAMKYLSHYMLYKKVNIEYVEKDSISLVDIKIVRNVLLDVSLNFEMLRFGYGCLVEEPQRKRVKSYKSAERYARIHLLGIHKKRAFKPRLPAANNAFWLQGSLGGSMLIGPKDFVALFVPADLSLHARWNKTLFTWGLTDEYIQQPFVVWGPYLGAGRAFSHSTVESGFYGGVRVFPLIEDDSTNIHFFPFIRIQAAKHGKNLGGGFSLEYSTNFTGSFFKLTANLLIGKWTHQEGK